MLSLPGRVRLPSLPRPAAVLTALLVTAALLFAPPPTFAQQDPPRAETAFADAVALYEQQLYAPAQEAFSDFRIQYPNHVNAGQALYLEARSALGLNRREAAVRLFEKLEGEYPNHPKAKEAQLSLGQYFLDQGNLAEGRAQLETVVRRETGTADAARALYLLGRAERESGQLQNALTSFQRAAREAPESDVAPAALYAAGATQVEMDQYEPAAEVFEQLGRQYPDSPYAQNLGIVLGEVYYELGRYADAARELSNRIPDETGDSQARALFLLAESYNQTGRTEDAIVTYRRVLDGFESDYERPALYGLAWTYRRAGTNVEAASNFARVRQTGSDTLAAQATYYEAVTRAEMGAPDRALSLFQTVLGSFPQHPLADEAQYEIGLLQYQRGNYNAAEAAFRALIRTYPRSARVGDAYYWLGNAYLASDDLDRALQAYNEATSRGSAPDSLRREVQFQKGWAQYERGRYAEAAPVFASLADAAPQSRRGQEALFWAGNSYYETGQLGQAEALLNRYIERYPNGQHAAPAQYALGWTHFKRQQYNQAAAAFRRFLDQYRAVDDDIPYRMDARLRLADSYYALKRYEDAVDTYRRVEGPAMDYSLYQTGQALNFAGRREEAVRTLRRIVEDYPRSSWRNEALYQIGFIEFQQQNYQASREAYQRLIQIADSRTLSARAQYGIGDTYYNTGDLQQAVNAYRAVLERYPDTPTATEAASSLFFALNAMGSDAQADAVVDSFAAANPNSDLVNQLRFRRAEAAYQSGDEDRALQLFRSFVRTSTNETLLPQAYYYLGVVYADRSQFNEARTYLQQLVQNYPDSDRRAEGALRLGDIHLEQSRNEAALQAYQTAAENDQIGAELQAQARYGQSVALTRLGRTQQAEDLLQSLIDRNEGGPLLASARLGLARIYDQTDRTSQAADLYRTVIQSSDTELGAEALFRLGRLLLTTGRAQDAIRELERMPSLFAGYPEWVARALLEQARANRELGQTGTATELYDQVIAEHAGTPYAETARAEKAAL